MKKFILFSLAIALPAFAAYAQPGQYGSPSVRFPVCDVQKATEKLETTPFHQIAADSTALAYRNEMQWRDFVWNNPSLKNAQKEKLMKRTDYPLRFRVEAALKGHGDLVNTYDGNAIAAAMVLAYADHRPLVLSPDAVWLLILQGFSAHIEANPEQMRPYFVDFEGTKQIRIKRNWMRGNPDNPWENVFEEFGVRIAENTKDGIAGACLPQFSTTGPAQKAAFEVSLMRAMDTYFDYEVELSCGIPEIILEGSPEDWALLEEHATALGRYELGWWIAPLKPILNEFTKASKGQVNTAFWQDIVKKRSYSIVCSSKPFLTGWMLHFFPYIKNKPNPWLVMADSVRLFEQAFEANEIAEKKLQAEAKSATPAGWRMPNVVKPEQFGLPSLNLSSLPNSMSKANVLLDDNGTAYDLEFLAGCIGIRQDNITMALRPEFGWRILDKGLHGQTPAEVYGPFIQDKINKRKP